MQAISTAFLSPTPTSSHSSPFQFAHSKIGSTSFSWSTQQKPSPSSIKKIENHCGRNDPPQEKEDMIKVVILFYPWKEWLPARHVALSWRMPIRLMSCNRRNDLASCLNINCRAIATSWSWPRVPQDQLSSSSHLLSSSSRTLTAWVINVWIPLFFYPFLQFLKYTASRVLFVMKFACDHWK